MHFNPIIFFYKMHSINCQTSAFAKNLSQNLKQIFILVFNPQINQIYPFIPWNVLWTILNPKDHITFIFCWFNMKPMRYSPKIWNLNSLFFPNDKQNQTIGPVAWDFLPKKGRKEAKKGLEALWSKAFSWFFLKI